VVEYTSEKQVGTIMKHILSPRSECISFTTWRKKQLSIYLYSAGSTKWRCLS